MDGFLHHNFFRGLHGDKVREALWPELEQLHTFNELLKQAQQLETDIVKRAHVKAHTNSISAQSEKDKDGSWL